MILPTKDEFVRLAEDHDVVPAAREVYLDLVTPISAFMALAEDQSPAVPCRPRAHRGTFDAPAGLRRGRP